MKRKYYKKTNQAKKSIYKNLLNKKSLAILTSDFYINMKSWFVLILTYAPIVNARFFERELTIKLTQKLRSI